MSTPNDSTKTQPHDRKCKCPDCRSAFIERVFSQVFIHDWTSTGAIRERLHMSGHPSMPNDVRAALWSLQSKPNQRIEVSRRGVTLFWRRIAKAEGR